MIPNTIPQPIPQPKPQTILPMIKLKRSNIINDSSVFTPIHDNMTPSNYCKFDDTTGKIICDVSQDNADVFTKSVSQVGNSQLFSLHKDGKNIYVDDSGELKLGRDNTKYFVPNNWREILRPVDQITVHYQKNLSITYGTLSDTLTQSTTDTINNKPIQVANMAYHGDKYCYAPATSASNTTPGGPYIKCDKSGIFDIAQIVTEPYTEPWATQTTSTE